MSTLLVIKSSIFGQGGESSRLTDRFVRGWLDQNQGGRVIVRDLATEPVPHLSAERFLAFTSKEDERTAEQRAVLAYSDALIDELRQATEIVLALPMYNFGIPSALKAYIDHIARAGVTFKYTASGPVGLLPNSKVHVIATRGGFYSGSVKDTSTQYLRDFLAFIGLTNVEFVYAEGLAVSPQQKAAALTQAAATIDDHFAATSLAAVA